ncbi:hypothetical protein NUU61_008391 [Penicillium alfredii]|uniref:Uncharacterized protein n=1 Tax=Penicillium alfredii TaxID=1506179 RepID=A0A9W9ESK5_9EURO|nr:uncharacterized protein NUU61_008391 [Penicillium alfredii]KAJ5087084.1 hypothetical protein NUU61_008391 [Penicillium alfredii]
MTYSSFLVRRGTELASAHFKDADKQPKEPPAGLVALLFLTFFLLFVAMAAADSGWLQVEYTFGMVVATLTAIEDTHPDIYVRIDADADVDPNKPVDFNEPELATATPPKPITSKLRTTIKHLRARAGFWSGFRGLSLYLAYSGLRGFISSFIPVPTTSFFGQFVIQSLLSVLLSTWQMAWVHIVISEPSPKRFYQRIPSWRTWIKIAPAAALENILTAAAFFLPMAVASFAGWVDTSNDKGVPPLVALYRFMGVSVVPALLAFLISVPARVVFIRVAASMLPEEDESIVPFDRSFGGKVNPAILGGSGCISLIEAWTTFDWSARVRFAKVIGKTFAIEVALGIFFVLVLGGQLFMLGTDNLHNAAGSKPNHA